MLAAGAAVVLVVAVVVFVADPPPLLPAVLLRFLEREHRERDPESPDFDVSALIVNVVTC